LLWDVPTGKQLRQLQVGTDVAAIRFTSDGKALVVSADNTERTFDLITGDRVVPLVSGQETGKRAAGN
jgi:hypothetical protein